MVEPQGTNLFGRPFLTFVTRTTTTGYIYYTGLGTSVKCFSIFLFSSIFFYSFSFHLLGGGREGELSSDIRTHTLSDLWRIPIGNSGVGSVVSHRRKSGWGLLILSSTFSRSLNHLTNRWQFWSINHWPRAIAVSRSWRASLWENV
jgi:hypothetical protein